MLNLDGEIVAKSMSSCFKDPVRKECGDDDDSSGLLMVINGY